MRELVRRIDYAAAATPMTALHADSDDPESALTPLVAREWLVTNGLGGYASGTVSGLITRRFHGLLIAALPAPKGRTMMLNHLAELIHTPSGEVARLGAQQRPDSSSQAAGIARLTEFRLDYGLPVWRYEHDGVVIERRLVMPYGQNTVHVTYRLLSGSAPVRVELQPWLNFRPHEGALDRPIAGPYGLTAVGDRYEVRCDENLPPLRLQLQGEDSSFTIQGERLHNVRYQIERSRGYDASGDLYSPGVFRAKIPANGTATLIASTEVWELMLALTPIDAARLEHERRGRLVAAADSRAREGVGGELDLAADQFLITPAGRVQDAARARAAGDEVRTVIAGYPWFTDWGRDTMISLEGLTLTTGRHLEAGYILRTFAHYVRDGLIPNMFPEGNNAGLYHTADATLWFFHAIDRYLACTRDAATLRLIMPELLDIVRHHVQGTHFGIKVDPQDGLLRQGQEGYQLTWMDAKVGDLVVTPRRGKAVEINALYYNALRLLEGWVRDESGETASRPYGELAEHARRSFNERFWYEPGGYLYDVIDGESGDDAAFRPNQLLAISLAHPILDPAKWKPVVDKCKERLLTPVGLRSLAPGHPDYKPKYFGDLRSRDLAYHQGTVWAWLIGPFIDAWLRVYPGERATAHGFLSGFGQHLSDACVGSISEIFDAEPPYTARGCVAQAWSVAEVLRCLVKTAS